MNERKTRNGRPRFWCWPSHQQEALSCCYLPQRAVKKSDLSTLNLQADDSFNHFPSFFFFLIRSPPLFKMFSVGSFPDVNRDISDLQNIPSGISGYFTATMHLKKKKASKYDHSLPHFPVITAIIKRRSPRSASKTMSKTYRLWWITMFGGYETSNLCNSGAALTFSGGNILH